jgi:hypothetical protein
VRFVHLEDSTEVASTQPVLRKVMFENDGIESAKLTVSLQGTR